MVPTWFLYISGFSLVLLGCLQIQARPRKKGDSLYTRFVNLGTMWSFICITVGTGILLIALGYVENPLAPNRPPEKPKMQERAS